MAVKVFNREGLRRDRNLSDLVDPQSAINNILASETMLGLSNSTSFTVDDLFPIQNIYITNITNSTFRSLDGVTVTFTNILPNGDIDNVNNPSPYIPLIKVKNRLDTAYFSTGEPFFFGGDGPNASYYDNNQIILFPEQLQIGAIYPINQIILSDGKLYRTQSDAQTSTSLTHTEGTISGFTYVADFNDETVFLNVEQDVLSGEDITIRDNFWERGQFTYGSKVQSSFISLFGGVNWQGFFKPTESGISRFYLRTTGSTWFKFQDPGTQSFVLSRYGQINTTDLANATTTYPGFNAVLYDKLNDIIADETKILVEVRLENAILLKDGDFIYIEVQQGPTVSKQYRILSLNSTPQNITKFWIEVTEDYNLKNVDLTTLPNVNLTPGAIEGYKCVLRYYPYENRQLKTYLNSIYHKLIIPSNIFTITGTNTIQFTDDFYYYHFMINDYIYDFRRRSSDPEVGIRRFIITELNDTTKTITVALDTNYTRVNNSNYNENIIYTDGTNISLDPQTGPQVDRTYTTGSISDTIVSGTQNLFFTGRYAETTIRLKYITIEQFLEAYVDYAFDWLYYTKDESVDPATQNKAWLLWYRSETSGAFYPLDYKYLYAKNYEFYEIGDFKTFLDNSIGGGGTSRETGINQRAFGGEQLVEPGDSYNTLYSLLPIRSNYTPKENWSKVALSRTISLTNSARLMSFGTTDVKVGNYIVQDSNIGFISGGSIPARTRIIDIIQNSSSVITSKPNTAGGSVSAYVLDHNGFVTTGVLTFDGNDYLTFQGDGSEIQIGMCLMLKNRANESSYTRITRVDYDSVNDVYQLTLDKVHETMFDGVGNFYAPTTQDSAVNDIIPTSGNPYWIDISPANADLDYYNENYFPIHDGNSNTYVYWVGPNEYTNGNVESATFDLRNFAAASVGGSGTGITDVRVYASQPFSGGGYNYVHYTAQLLDVNKNPIANTQVSLNSTSLQLIQLPNSNNSNARYLRFKTSANYPSAYPRLFLSRIYVNGQYVDNSANNTVSDRCAIYYDRGVDITKPLAFFCTGTACAQNNYDVNTGEVLTKYISVEVGDGPGVLGLNPRWTEASATGVYGGGNNPDKVELVNGDAKVKWWSEAFPNQNFENHGEAIYNGGKRYASNCIFAKLTGTDIGTALINQGHANLTSDYIPIGFIEAIIMIDGDIWNGTTISDPNQLKAHFIIRLANRWQSYTDFDVFADGGQRGKIVDFTKFPSSDFNLEYFGFAPDQSLMLGLAISNLDVSTGAILDSAYTNYVNNINDLNYIDKIHRITTDITLTSTQRAYFQNPDSFSRFNETTQLTEYVLPQGSYFKTLSTTGLLVWFSNFEDLQHTHSLYSYPFEVTPTTPPNQLPQSRIANNAINIYPQDGPVRITSNNWQTDQFRYLHYRRKQYEILPTPTFIEERFPGLRVINQNEQTTNVNSFLANTTNKLSVFTFANTIENKELCCPPLDTSPPFDSSSIGLATTSTEPNMNIGGLINVRSISANHPKNKIHNIPSGQSPTSLPVDKKLEIVFGGVKYDLLIADTKPF